MSHRPTLVRKAHAKVNLALVVAPPRIEDGLHPIASWMASINLADDLTICRLEEDRDSRYAILWAGDALRKTDIDWSITKDLAVRAHLALEREVGARLPVQMKLEKRIPVGAGLGGGSSDAAATLLAVRELFALSVSDERLREIGLSLGADVPFFLPPEPGSSAFVSGVGEVVERAPTTPSAGLLLIAPEFSCDTGAVYRAFDEEAMERSFADAADRVRALALAGDIRGEDLVNDLAQPAQRVAPALAGLIDKVTEALGVAVHVTGSGSALFALFEDGAAADAMRAQLADHPALERAAVAQATLGGAVGKTAPPA